MYWFMLGLIWNHAFRTYSRAPNNWRVGIIAKVRKVVAKNSFILVKWCCLYYTCIYTSHAKGLRNLKNVLLFFYSELLLIYSVFIWILRKFLWKHYHNFEVDLKVPKFFRKTNFLLSNMHTYVWVSEGKKVSFTEKFMFLLNEWFHIWFIRISLT